MKALITMSVFIGILTNTGVNAQALTEQELAVIAADQITASQQAQIKSSENLKAGAGFVTVGNDAACDYRLGTTKIQDAINNGNTEIRIAEGTYVENIVIDDVDVQLLGGYADCPDANNNIYNAASVATKISPTVGSARPAIRVTGNTQRNSLTLRNLTIQRGEDWSFYSAGGVAFLSADYAVTMNKLSISQNHGLLGGGVSIIGADTNIDMYNVTIGANDASADAGGLYCSGASSIIFNSADTNSAATIINNTTVGDGGGVYITNNCTFTDYVGTGPGFDFRGIIANKADGSGGGIYASAGGKVYLYGNKSCSFTFPYTCKGYNTQPVSLTSNSADDDNDGAGNGGAVFATGSATTVYAANVRVNNNSGDNGGAVAVDDGALFQTYTTYYYSLFITTNSCWDNGRCNQYTGNSASTSNGYGGAFFAENGGKLIVTRTQIEGNRADLGSAFYLRDADTDLDLEGSYITGNGSADADDYNDSFPVRIYTDASARIDYTTIADNEVPSGSASLGNFSGSLRIYSSIVHDLSGADALIESTPVISDEDCLIVSALGDVNDLDTVVDDPDFVNRANNDYHINAALSPAVDYCDELVAEHSTQDTDQEDRGWDDYVATNNFSGSFFDVGADETYQNDVIFEDEFE